MKIRMAAEALFDTVQLQLRALSNLFAFGVGKRITADLPGRSGPIVLAKIRLILDLLSEERFGIERLNNRRIVPHTARHRRERDESEKQLPFHGIPRPEGYNLYGSQVRGPANDNQHTFMQ